VKEPRCLSGHVQYQAAACSRDRDRACSYAIAEAVTCAAILHSRCFGTVHTQTRTHTKSMHHSLCIHLATPSAPPHLTSTAPTRGSDSDRDVYLHGGKGFPSLLQVFPSPSLILASDRSAGQCWMPIGRIRDSDCPDQVWFDHMTEIICGRWR
jgi:hypothetical protein